MMSSGQFSPAFRDHVEDICAAHGPGVSNVRLLDIVLNSIAYHPVLALEHHDTSDIQTLIRTIRARGTKVIPPPPPPVTTTTPPPPPPVTTTPPPPPPPPGGGGPSGAGKSRFGGGWAGTMEREGQAWGQSFQNFRSSFSNAFNNASNWATGNSQPRPKKF